MTPDQAMGQGKIIERKRRLKIASWVFFLGMVVSFFGGAICRSIYQGSGKPEWLNSLVMVFMGLNYCFASLMLITSAFAYHLGGPSIDDKIKGMIALVIGIPSLPLGIFMLCKGVVELLGSLS